jgi:hypothetical protein
MQGDLFHCDEKHQVAKQQSENVSTAAAVPLTLGAWQEFHDPSLPACAPSPSPSLSSAEPMFVAATRALPCHVLQDARAL